MMRMAMTMVMLVAQKMLELGENRQTRTAR